VAGLEASYDAFPRIEEAFQGRLDESLDPRGPEALYDLVAGLGLPAGARVVDVGCGEGREAVELARRFGFSVAGVDPVARHGELARTAGVRAAVGVAEALPVASASCDLVWCREVLVLVRDLERVVREVRRVLRPGGRAVVYQMWDTDLLEPAEASRLWGPASARRENVDVARFEAVVVGAGLRLDGCTVYGSEWGEAAQERSGTGGRRLAHAARLLRAPDRYVAEFGRSNYEIMLADCLWHVYRMLGKIEGRAYVLSAPP
jgi:SAM-dependent methyltransferase